MDKEAITTVNINGMEVGCEFVNTKKEFKWRLVGMGEESPWSTDYQGILVHQFTNGRKFGLATDFWNGTLPIEIPFEIVEVTAPNTVG